MDVGAKLVALKIIRKVGVFTLAVLFAGLPVMAWHCLRMGKIRVIQREARTGRREAQQPGRSPRHWLIWCGGSDSYLGSLA